MAGKKKKDKMSAGKLYSLTKLQNFLGKKYKMSMAESLEILQGLYEKGFVTYPRTNSEYLATAEKGKIKTILASVKGLGYPVEFKDDKKIQQTYGHYCICIISDCTCLIFWKPS